MPWALQESAKTDSRFASLLRERLGADARVADLVVASFAAAVCDEGVGSNADVWGATLRDTCLECGLEDELPEIFYDLIASLQRHGVVLDVKDGLYHEVVVKAVLDSVVAPPAPKQKRETAAQQTAEMRRYRVLFTEWCKPQELAEDLVVNIEIVVDDDDDESRGEGGAPTRIFLATYGMLLCRPCHTHVHRVGSNDELAETLSAPSKILAHPAVQIFLAWRIVR
ncbi:hypothetical protein T492DRAFT_888129 [Pavlovales sp. CCMP2436]|nr:hypothetical protein T492DRAFT_888129 [Pavlovales sp. CCMP2436]